MSLQTIDNPAREDVYSVYTDQKSADHWRRINGLVLVGGFWVDPNPYATHDAVSTSAQLAPDFRVAWPTPELETQDHDIFFAATQMVMRTLDLDDALYAQSVVPKIFKILGNSYLFTQLFDKPPTWRGITVENHVKTVPTLVQTSQVDMRERFILRMTAIFHDVGKAFNIGRDQVHYHALIGSNIFYWFFEKNKDRIIDALWWPDKILVTPVLLRKNQGEKVTREELKQEFSVVQNQISEIIRLHHVLEQIDKGVLDLETVAEIFVDKSINPLTFGLFIIADGSSVIPDDSRYAKFLVDNLIALFELLDRMEFNEILKSTVISLEMKQTFVQSLQHVIREIITKTEGLPEKLQEIIRDVSNRLNPVLATALLSLAVPEVVKSL